MQTEQILITLGLAPLVWQAGRHGSIEAIQISVGLGWVWWWRKMM